MKALTTALFGKLAGSSLDTDIGGRLFKGRAPENSEYPYAVFFMVSDMQIDTFKDKLDEIMIQFSLFSNASSSSEIEDMFTHLKALYDDCVLTPTSETVCLIKRENSILFAEEHPTPAGVTQIWHYAVEYSIVLQKN